MYFRADSTYTLRGGGGGGWGGDFKACQAAPPTAGE